MPSSPPSRPIGCAWLASPLTPAQAAEFIPRHVGQIRTMCETGEIEAIDISTGKARRWKIPRSAIRAWLVNHNNQTARRSA